MSLSLATPLITSALCDAVREARAQMPVRDVALDDEAETYSAGEGDGASEEDRKKRRPRRKRKARPEDHAPGPHRKKTTDRYYPR